MQGLSALFAASRLSTCILNQDGCGKHMILISLVSEKNAELRPEHDSEVGWQESDAKTKGFESPMNEMWPGLRRQHDSEVIGSESYTKTNGFESLM